MQVRAYNHWASLLDDRNFPSIEDLEPDEPARFRPLQRAARLHRGHREPRHPLPRRQAGRANAASATTSSPRCADVPSRSLLTRITDHYMQILANQAPIGFEAEFVNQRGATIAYRGILLPFSSDDDTIDFIYGVINWKELADAQASDELLLEIDQALEPKPSRAGARGRGAADRLGRRPRRDDAAANDLADAPRTTDDGRGLRRRARFAARLRRRSPDEDDGLPVPSFGLDERRGRGRRAAVTRARSSDRCSRCRSSSPKTPSSCPTRASTSDFDEHEFDLPGADRCRRSARRADGATSRTPTEPPIEPMDAELDERRAVEPAELSKSRADVDAAPSRCRRAGSTSPRTSPSPSRRSSCPSSIRPRWSSATGSPRPARWRSPRAAARTAPARRSTRRSAGPTTSRSPPPRRRPSSTSCVADSGLTMQDRAPMTPVVKLVFGADYDKTRLTEYAAALTHAHRLELPRGTLGDYLARGRGRPQGRGQGRAPPAPRGSRQGGRAGRRAAPRARHASCARCRRRRSTRSPPKAASSRW